MPRAPLLPPLASRGRLAMTEAELSNWGERLGSAVTPPTIVTVGGELGSGKTRLVQAISRGYGVCESVTSPTFALIHQYHAPRSPVYHLDLYRIVGPADLTNLGWDELMAEHALILIEWPERATGRVPRDHIPIRLEYLPDDDSRRLLYAGGHV